MTAINVSSLNSALGGSSFDWQSFIDQIIEIDSAPIQRLQIEQSVNEDKLAALGVLGTNISALQTAAKALSGPALFGGRTASTSAANSTWNLSASTGATTGSYTIAVSQLATATKRTGASNIGSGLSATADVSGVTLASMPTATAVTAGTFTVNGSKVTVALTDSLQDIFDKISTATSGAVTASYDPSSDAISLNAASPIVLGAANDTSNFLSVARLNNNDTGTVTSSAPLGTATANVPLASARLATSFGAAVDGSGNGTFAVNGVDIAYNINTDSLSDVIARINASSAGVTASYDSAGDRMIVTNKSTGDLGVNLVEASGGFLDAVGLNDGTAGMSTARGKNALFSINGGTTLSSASNTLTEAATGIAGLSVTANSETTQTITVASDTAAMKSAIQTFVDKYNLVQSYIDLQTAVTVSGGKINASLLSNNREVQEWGRTMRSKAFAEISGLTGTVKRLADLGIDFQGTGSQLIIRDSAKLDAALRDKPDAVQSFFTTPTTGFVDSMNSVFTNLLGVNGTKTDGALGSAENALTRSNVSIDNQIAAIQRQLESQRSRLTASFQAMQAAQQQAQSMIDTLNNAFKTNSSNSK